MRPLLLFFFITLATSLSAQIVNIEDKRSVRSDTIAWYGRVDLGFGLVENGSSILNWQGAASIEHVHRKHWWLLLSNFNQVKVDDKDFVNDGFLHFRYNYHQNDWLTYEGFTQTQYNEKLNLRLRWLLGGGLRIRLSGENIQKAYIGFTYMYEYNEETKPEEIFFRDHRLSNYVSFSVVLWKNLEIASTNYYQPVFVDFSDWRLSSKTSLLFKITERLRFNTSFVLTYDSRVPEGVANTIYRLTNGFRFDF